MPGPSCSHLDQIAVAELPETIAGCEDCLATGGRWVHLRMCMTCGKIGCCDSSPNRHASRHADADATSDRALGRAGREVELVLRRRGRLRAPSGVGDLTAGRFASAEGQTRERAPWYVGERRPVAPTAAFVISAPARIVRSISFDCSRYQVPSSNWIAGYEL